MKYITYLYTKKIKLTKKTGSFVSSININDTLKYAKGVKFNASTYGSGKNGDDRQVDKDVRLSEISEITYDLGKITLEDINFDGEITIGSKYEFIKYNKGGHFEEHDDRKRNSKHTHTVCIYPPQDVEGGELIINKNIVIPTSKNKWIMVIFPIEILHKSNLVTNGTKYLFKGTAKISTEDEEFVEKPKKVSSGRKD